MEIKHKNMETLVRNRDFLFIYDAKQCNPNGDPDQENKPRMDYDTKRNIVTDVRLKRYIRDYLKDQGNEIFVSLEDDAKVAMDTKLKNFLDQNLKNDLDKIFADDQKTKKHIEEILKNKQPSQVLVKKLNPNKQEDKEILAINKRILRYYIANNFVDIRMFGSAFAVDGFTFPLTGAIQINWGYSLNKTYLAPPNTITSIMSDENSTFGKDYRLWYSLIAFYGTINEKAAEYTFLTENDLKLFRKAIWNSLTAKPTRSKLNQYPILYLEIEYKDDIANGQLRDLREYIKVKDRTNSDFKNVGKFDDLEVDFFELFEAIKKAKGKIEKVHYLKSDVLKIDFPNGELYKEITLKDEENQGNDVSQRI